MAKTVGGRETGGAQAGKTFSAGFGYATNTDGLNAVGMGKKRSGSFAMGDTAESASGGFFSPNANLNGNANGKKKMSQTMKMPYM